MSRRKLPAGSTSIVVPVLAMDTSSTSAGMLSGILYNSSGLAAKYRREGDGSWTTITLQSATVGTFPTGGGGWIADAGPVSGSYEFSIPNAALASGARWAVVVVYGFTNLRPIFLEFELTATNDQDSAAGGMIRLDAAVSTRLATAGYTAPTTPPTVTQIRQELDNNSTKLANLDATTSSRLAAASYLSPPSASSIATSVLTTQLTESYAADGAAPTLAQALLLIQQKLGDFSITGTTLTVKKLDGSTAAATYTLNSSTDPTSITRSA